MNYWSESSFSLLYMQAHITEVTVLLDCAIQFYTMSLVCLCPLCCRWSNVITHPNSIILVWSICVLLGCSCLYSTKCLYFNHIQYLSSCQKNVLLFFEAWLPYLIWSCYLPLVVIQRMFYAMNLQVWHFHPWQVRTRKLNIFKIPATILFIYVLNAIKDSSLLLVIL